MLINSLPRWGRMTFACLIFALAIPAASAATYYVRADGGSATQCNGQSNAAYPGSGINRACAWNHPFVALPPGGTPRIKGGDTLHIGSGSYRMGYGAPNTQSCSRNDSGSCHMPAIPSGPTPTQPTRILGQGHAQGCTKAPELWGTEGASMVVNMQGSSNVEMACLEITDRGSCAVAHCNSGQCTGEVAACNRTSPPYGDWASTGLSARDSNAVWLRDINIHGLANTGVHAGRISGWTMERIKINANGWSGWSGNIGEESSNWADIIFREAEIGWNGCIERYPSGEIFGCWGQKGGGWGDGIGTGTTAGHWVFEDSTIHHNTSDGIDLLYLNDHGSATIKRTLVENNAGNQVKVSRSAKIENSVIVGHCSFFKGHHNMLDGDHCRAAGDAVFIGLSNNSQTDLINNTIVSEGNCIISGGGGSSTSRLRLINNLLIGKPNVLDPSKQSCLYYSGDSNEQMVWDRNFIRATRNNDCPGNSLCNGSPQLTDERLSSFNATPRQTSPLIGAANRSLAPVLDYLGHPRGRTGRTDIGAIEYRPE